MKKKLLMNALAGLLAATVAPAQGHAQGIYEIALDDLLEVSLVSSTDAATLKPSYNLSLEDLMALQIVKVLKMSERLQLSYEMEICDLMELEIRQRGDTSELTPSYDMSLTGIMSLEVETDYQVQEVLLISYEISLEGLMTLDVVE